jgi:transposase
MSIREIARRTGLSRNTVKKYLRAGEKMPRYAKRESSSKLDPHAKKLATWLAIEATKSRKQRRNLRQIHTVWRCTSVPPALQALQENQRGDHHESQLRRVG